MTGTAAKVRTCLWFDDNAEAAAELYSSLLPNSEITEVMRPTPDGPALVVELNLAGTPYMLLNGGSRYSLSPAASIVVRTADQAETDRLWHGLVDDGGEESMCGWLVDRFGVSWQVVPGALPRLLGSKDAAAAQRVTEAMMAMKKINIAALEAAHRGEQE